MHDGSHDPKRDIFLKFYIPMSWYFGCKASHNFFFPRLFFHLNPDAKIKPKVRTRLVYKKEHATHYLLNTPQITIFPVLLNFVVKLSSLILVIPRMALLGGILLVQTMMAMSLVFPAMGTLPLIELTLYATITTPNSSCRLVCPFLRLRPRPRPRPRQALSLSPTRSSRSWEISSRHHSSRPGTPRCSGP